MSGLRCPACGHPLSPKVQAQLAGENARCDACSATLRMDPQRRALQIVSRAPATPARTAARAPAPLPLPAPGLSVAHFDPEPLAETPPPVAVTASPQLVPEQPPASKMVRPRGFNLVGLTIAAACVGIVGAYVVLHPTRSAPVATAVNAPATKATPAPTTVETRPPAAALAAAEPAEPAAPRAHHSASVGHHSNRSSRIREHRSSAERAPRELAAAEPERESNAGIERRSLLATTKLSPADAASQAYQLYKAGSALLLAGDAPAAAEAYLNALRRDPKGAAGYRGLGLAYAEMDNSAAAIRYLRHYLKIAGTAPDRDLILKRVRLMVAAARDE